MNAWLNHFHLLIYTPRPLFPWFFGSKMISVVQKTVQIKLFIKPTKKQCTFKGPINNISVDQKFWARIGNSVASKSVHIKALVYL